MVTKLNQLSVGQKFRFNTKRPFLSLHDYEVEKIENGKITYKHFGKDVYNQRITTSGNEKVILI